MKFFIDTANLAQIKEAQDLGVLDGVTTNPSLMAKEGIKGGDNILKHYVDICKIVSGDVSAEVISTDFDGMVREGDVVASGAPGDSRSVTFRVIKIEARRIIVEREGIKLEIPMK